MQRTSSGTADATVVKQKRTTDFAFATGLKGRNQSSSTEATDYCERLAGSLPWSFSRFYSSVYSLSRLPSLPAAAFS